MPCAINTGAGLFPTSPLGGGLMAPARDALPHILCHCDYSTEYDILNSMFFTSASKSIELKESRPGLHTKRLINRVNNFRKDNKQTSFESKPKENCRVRSGTALINCSWNLIFYKRNAIRNFATRWHSLRIAGYGRKLLVL